jgi:hypothetical protein
LAVKHLLASTLIASGLLSIPALPAVAQSIDVGPGGVRVDPRSPRERDRDEIRREEFRDGRGDAIRREERLRREDDDDDD